MLINAPDGDGPAFHNRFIEDKVLGEGEFGQVKRVYETSNPNVPLACKTLKKGMVFKDNQLYPALPPEMLRGEIEILRALQGRDTFCLQLHSIYETPKAILVITEICEGGEMMEFVAAQETDLRTEDVSRISFQLLSAIDFCAKQNIIHRDLKPQNIMFESNDSKSSLRVIDFGGSVKNDPSNKESLRHTTFCGTPFYNSPEMFAQKYTQKTDVFSIGVTLYVLVAGYPADELQKAFNILQSSAKGPKRNLKALPNMPQNMPESYYDMLEELLTFQPKNRKTAGEMTTHTFATFHQDLAKEVAEEGEATDKRPSMFLRQSCVLTGTAQRHNVMLGYKNFERSLTTLLATMLSPADLRRLVDLLTKTQNELVEGIEDETEATTGSDSDKIGSSPTVGQLGTVPLDRLVKILEDDLDNDGVVKMIKGLPNAAQYNTYAYHTNLLQDFVKPGGAAPETDGTSSGGRERRHSHYQNGGLSRRLSMRKSSAGGARRHSHLQKAGFSGISMRNLGGKKKGVDMSGQGSGEFRSIASSHHAIGRPTGSLMKAQSVMIKGL